MQRPGPVAACCEILAGPVAEGRLWTASGAVLDHLTDGSIPARAAGARGPPGRTP